MPGPLVPSIACPRSNYAQLLRPLFGWRLLLHNSAVLWKYLSRVRCYKFSSRKARRLNGIIAPL
jgi:hypothetical protein